MLRDLEPENGPSGQCLLVDLSFSISLKSHELVLGPSQTLLIVPPSQREGLVNYR